MNTIKPWEELGIVHTGLKQEAWGDRNFYLIPASALEADGRTIKHLWMGRTVETKIDYVKPATDKPGYFTGETFHSIGD